MSTAHTEAIAMAVFSLFWLSVAALAFRLQRRTGQKSQWRYVALIAAAFGLVLMILNLEGHVFSGAGSARSQPEPSMRSQHV